MKVLLINGSPKKEGCTYTALKEVADELERNGVETEIFHIGTAPVKGCMGCGYCAKTGNHQCVYNDDTLNEAILKAKDADGFVFGSPVHYASASGAITSFLDRLFYAGYPMAHKPGAAVVSCRPVKQVFYDCADAGCFIKLLEYGAWQYTGRSLSG